MSETSLIVDLTNFKDRVGTNVPEGRYTVQVEDIEIDTSNGAATKGSRMLIVFFRVTSGDHEGATLIDRLIVHDKTMFRVVGFMQALGIPTPKKRLKLDVNRFIGRMLQIDVEDGEPYNGRVRSEIRGYLRIPKGQETTEADLDDLEDVSDEPTAEEKKSAEPASGDVEDDIDDIEELDLAEIDI